MTALLRVGSWLEHRSPWTNVVGLARSLIATSLLGTLLFTPTHVMFSGELLERGPHCHGIGGAGLYCLLGPDRLTAGRALAVLVLVITASGWRPRITAIPFWYVVFSVQAGSLVPDGGDQLAAILALLLVPVGLSDGRRWHWSAPPCRPVSPVWSAMALVSLGFVKLQVAGVYAHAAIGKFSVEEWGNGTALYYWMQEPQFGPAGLRANVMDVVVSTSPGVVALTYGTILLELALAAAIIGRRRPKLVLLGAGVLFHLGIAVVIGLWSFGLVMWAALLLYLWPTEQPLRPPWHLWVGAGPESVAPRPSMERPKAHA